MNASPITKDIVVKLKTVAVETEESAVIAPLRGASAAVRQVGLALTATVSFSRRDCSLSSVPQVRQLTCLGLPKN